MRIKKSYIFSSSTAAILFLLIGSPAFSITKAIFGIFLPNEKIAFTILFLLIYIFKDKLNNNFIRLIKLSLIILLSYALFFVLRELFLGVLITIPNINNLMGLVSTIILSSYLSLLKPRVITKALLYAMIIQVLIALIQIYVLSLGDIELFSKFNNYYSQCILCTGYRHPITTFGLFRVPGLFNEASGLSSFSAISLIYSISISKLTKYCRLIPAYFSQIKNNEDFSSKDELTIISLMIISTMGLLLSFSTTGLLMVIIFSLLLTFDSLTNRLGSIKLKYIFILVGVSFISIKLNLFGLFFNTFSNSQRSDYTYEVFSGLFEKPDVTFFFGSEAIWSGASWDIISRFIQVLGLLGSIPLWLTIFYLIFSRNFVYCLSIIPIFLSNAQFSMAHSILCLGLIVLINFKNAKSIIIIN